VSKITEKQLPLLDDDFAKDLDADDLQKLTATVWNQLVEFRRWQQRSDQKKELVEQLLEKSQFEVPESLVEDRADALMKIDRELQRTEESEVSEEDRAKYKEMALELVKRTWLLDEIAKNEEVEATDAEVEAEVRRMAEERDRDPQKYMRLLEAANRIDSIKDSIRENKIYDLMIEKASPKRGLIV
jgi:trigger factor